MYHDLWDACYGETEPVRAEAILAAAHRLLAREGGEPSVVLAAAMLATVAREHRDALLDRHVERDLHGEIHGILDQDPGNKNTAIVHDAVLLASYHKGLWRGAHDTPAEAIAFLEAMLPKFRTTAGHENAKHFLAERRHDAAETMPPGARPLAQSDVHEADGEESPLETSGETHKEPQLPLQGMKSEGHDAPKKDEGRIYHWADQYAERVITERGPKATYIVEAGITPSGDIHIGNFREIITHDLVAKALERRGKKVIFYYIWDDYDTFRKIPKNVPKQEELKAFLFQPGVDVPDPFECNHASWADHFKAPVLEDLPHVGINPTFIDQHKRYRACYYAEDLKFALQHREQLREVLNDYKTDEISVDWWPVNVYCQACNRDRSVRITGYDGQYGVSYECDCGNKNTFDLRKSGIAKLAWRVDWPMRWAKFGVDFEGAGKEHLNEGGSHHSSQRVVKEVYGANPPVWLKYDFITIKGQGGKMSSSKGNTITLREVLKVYPAEIVRFLFAGTRPDVEFAISFDIDVFKVYEDFDTVERKYFGAEDVGNDKDKENARRTYELSILAPPSQLPIQPSFRHLTTYVQLAEGDLDKVVEMMRDEIKSEYDEARIRRRAQCAWNWAREYAPDQYKFTLATDKPYPAQLADPVRDALRALGNILAGQNEEELLETFYQLCERHGIQNTEFFRGAYLTLVGKERGPKLANIITQAGHERIAGVLKQL